MINGSIFYERIKWVKKVVEKREFLDEAWLLSHILKYFEKGSSQFYIVQYFFFNINLKNRNMINKGSNLLSSVFTG